MMHPVVTIIAEKLKALKEQKVPTIGLTDVAEMMKEVIATLNSQFVDDQKIYADLQDISQSIHDAKEEAGHVLQDDDKNMNNASAQLSEVVRETEEAANTIIDAASAIQNLVPDNKEVEALVTRIFENCNFGDLSRQRILKVVSHLENIETRLEKVLKTLNLERKNKGSANSGIVLDGPQVKTEAATQDDIDALFNSL